MSLLTRRNFLLRAGALGCSAAASPLMTPVTFASAPWDNRLIVIILRGGMDGLDVVRPYGDPEFAGLRAGLSPVAETGPQDLDGFYALHPALSGLRPMWQAGQLSFAHAVSTPYRDKRSHFDGQDMLEAGGATVPGATTQRSGWLNRLLLQAPGHDVRTAFAVGREDLTILAGAAEVSNWAPDTRLVMSAQAKRLLELVTHDDPLFADNAAEALELAAAIDPEAEAPEDFGDMLQDMTEGMAESRKGKGHVKLAEFTASQLRQETRIAAFSLNNWDTHRNQARTIRRSLSQLQEVLLTLQQELGPVWEKTAVLAMTEFGRTARANGTGGTDHGTGGLMLMAGGAVRGGKVHGKWPGLAAADLYKERDLMPTEDVRTYAAMAIQGLFGTERSVLEGTVFPGLDMGARPQVIL
ncbi:hypothetical protein PSA7680_02163 [Pseudoruegeria aquimaris]|uniref:Twin-arginine translocation pathway signal n=1 Tax=Pseudoruegeria aquimaris TaxID=393663 RepID=A0A1Y5SQZ0_9RHOB|nr:DUF1501 domain-containing protein [Pseudoruegeria aquimaris]SLN43240.1 hypothetical protein PSA7680_02163 [Pseudoruegeria aquimaris]